MTTTSETSTPTLLAKPGKYLTFRLGHECYGLPVLQVREIIRLVDITPVPQMPPDIRGVINLRGKIIPVADLRVKFGLAQTEANEQNCIVVVQVRKSAGSVFQLGLIVDAVQEVVQIGTEDLEETPQFGSQATLDYILGIAKLKDRVVILLDMDKVLAAGSLEQASFAATPTAG